MAKKYVFTEEPQKGKFGIWVTADGFKCYTDNRQTAVRWYRNYLKKGDAK